MSRSVWSAAYPGAFRHRSHKPRITSSSAASKAAGYAALQTLRAIRLRLGRAALYHRVPFCGAMKNTDVNKQGGRSGEAFGVRLSFLALSDAVKMRRSSMTLHCKLKAAEKTAALQDAPR